MQQTEIRDPVSPRAHHHVYVCVCLCIIPMCTNLRCSSVRFGCPSRTHTHTHPPNFACKLSAAGWVALLMGWTGAILDSRIVQFKVWRTSRAATAKCAERTDTRRDAARLCALSLTADAPRRRHARTCGSATATVRRMPAIGQLPSCTHAYNLQMCACVCLGWRACSQSTWAKKSFRYVNYFRCVLAKVVVGTRVSVTCRVSGFSGSTHRAPSLCCMEQLCKSCVCVCVFRNAR